VEQERGLSWYVMLAAALSIVLLPWLVLASKWMHLRLHGLTLAYWLVIAVGAWLWRRRSEQLWDDEEPFEDEREA
jgi:uncharacterized membrane protein YqjE